jgi:hypothetical protein
MPENRIAAGGNQFARPSEAREPATRFSITPSREPAASSGRPGGASWPHAQPGYQKQQGRFIVSCSTRQRRQSPRCSLRARRNWPVTVRALAEC